MKPVKFRWSKVYESSEEELIEFLAARNIVTERLPIDEFAAFGEPARIGASTIWCGEGSMNLQIAGVTFSIQTGDGLNIPANEAFTATAGMSGCVYYRLPRA